MQIDQPEWRFLETCGTFTPGATTVIYDGGMGVEKKSESRGRRARDKRISKSDKALYLQKCTDIVLGFLSIKPEKP